MKGEDRKTLVTTMKMTDDDKLITMMTMMMMMMTMTMTMMTIIITTITGPGSINA